MSKSIINFIVDAVAFIAIVLLAATGVLMRYVLPAGSGHFITLWGMDRHEWGQIHFWIAIALIGIMVIHLFLHWRWIVCIVKGTSHSGKAVRVALAMGGVTVLFGLAVVPFLSQVEEAGEPPHKLRSEEYPEVPADQINGSMTLQEVEQRTGVPTAVILKELGLPVDAPLDERLGRLRRKYDFEIHDVREIVRKHFEKR
jgi:hypothetical protein